MKVDVFWSQNIIATPNTDSAGIRTYDFFEWIALKTEGFSFKMWGYDFIIP